MEKELKTIEDVIEKNIKLFNHLRSENGLHKYGVMGSALFAEMGSFAVQTFPDAGSVEHLKKLKHEADEAIAEPQNVEEYADCLLALFGAAHKAGITYETLLNASAGKLEIVKQRSWNKLPDGTYQHCP